MTKSSKKPGKVTQPMKDEMQQLRALGKTYPEIAHAVGVHCSTVEYHLNSSKHSARRVTKEHGINWRDIGIYEFADPAIKRKAAELYKQVPKDTRTLTARLLGDPLPGRSALDRMQSA